MIRAHMATYPARSDILLASVAEISAQVDRLFLVLNEYAEIPPEVEANHKVEAFIPEEDYKDVGKFVFEPASDDIVFFVDDDVRYPSDFVQISVEMTKHIGLEKNVFGYHCSIYHDELSRGANSRRIFQLWRRNREFVYVDQIATNAMIALGSNVPPLRYMKGSQKFVDVRYAKWLHENNINSIVLPRRRQYIQNRASNNPDDTSIWATFTKNSPDHVLEEIKSYAGKSPLVGKQVSEVH